MMKLLQVALIAAVLLVEVHGYELPADFRELRIGMEWREVIRARPNAELLDLLPESTSELEPDTEQPKEGLIEVIDRGLINGILYQFNEGRLGGLSFVYRSESGIGDRLLTQFLERYGTHEDIQSSVQTGYGMVKWMVDGHNLYLTIPFERGDDKDKIVAYQIMDMETAGEFEASRNVELKKKPLDQDGLDALEVRVLALYDLVRSGRIEERVEESEPTEHHRSQAEPEPKTVAKDEPEVESSNGEPEAEKPNNLPYILFGVVAIWLVITLIRRASKR